MDPSSFFLSKAFEILSLILIAAVLSGIYLIWRDGFEISLVLMVAASSILLIVGNVIARKNR
jgi:hypothetical protein